ncbi:hypothetical protein LCGC14_1142530 [marine sediment metagenome]|uniref:Uncharacterized protein n=1 Tax=marine sediment metagenome TaxID=412755 RepID=A0A0F9LXX9_9ZZZZ
MKRGEYIRVLIELGNLWVGQDFGWNWINNESNELRDTLGVAHISNDPSCFRWYRGSN